MSSEADAQSNDPADPLDVFREANRRFHTKIEGIDPDDPNGQNELIEAVDEFIGAVAESDPRETIKRQTISIVAENAPFMTKRSAESSLNEALRDVERREDGRPEITDILMRNVVQIEQLVTDEAEGDIRYRFVFADGGSLVVDPETLYSPTEFRRAYDSQYGVLPRFDGDIEYWEAMLHELKEEYQVVKADSVGPRSAAINDLRSKINSSEAYLDREDAARHSGVLIDEPSGDPEKAEEHDTIWILSDEVRRICKDHEIEIESLRVEMDNRDLRTGATVQKRVGGRRIYWWQLKREEFREKLIEAPQTSNDPDPAEPEEDGDRPNQGDLDALSGGDSDE